MPFNWDTLDPADTGDISLYPADARAFRTTVQSFVQVEHDDVEGRHKFGAGDDAARNVFDADWVVGSLWLNTGVVTGKSVLQRCTGAGPGATWENVGLVFDDTQQTWTKAQWGDVVDFGTLNGNIDFDTREAHHFTLTANGNINFVDPTNQPTVLTETTSFTVEVQQSGGPWNLTFPGSKWVSTFQTLPELTQVADAFDVFSVVYLPAADKFLISPLPDVG